MPPHILTYCPVSSTGFHLGGGVWMTAVEERLAAGAEGFAPHYFRLISTFHAPRRGLKHTARFNPTKD